MKKNCNRCKALILEKGCGYHCELGHKIDTVNATPLELCEKPLTNMDYIYAKQNPFPKGIPLGAKNGTKIHKKDIQDFEKHAKKLGEVIARIREYCPEAYIFAAPNELNLMSGVNFLRSNRVDEDERLTALSVPVPNLDCGDW